MITPQYSHNNARKILLYFFYCSTARDETTTTCPCSSVRWTGHLSAISINRVRSDSVKSFPASAMCRSMRSNRGLLLFPDERTHSSQSFWWTLLWDNLTDTPVSGNFLRSAYMRIVMTVQEPRADKSKSYGDGPRSPPPTLAGSSASSSCFSLITISVRNGEPVAVPFSLSSRSSLATTWDMLLCCKIHWRPGRPPMAEQDASSRNIFMPVQHETKNGDRLFV